MISKIEKISERSVLFEKHLIKIISVVLAVKDLLVSIHVFGMCLCQMHRHLAWKEVSIVL